MDEFLTKDQFDEFKTILHGILDGKDQEILSIKASHEAFTKENLRVLQKIENIDWKTIHKADMLITQVL